MSTDGPEVRPRPQLRTGRRALVAGGVIAAALGFLLWRGLGDAAVYFKTADEAVAQRADLGERRFRIEGAVVPGSVRPSGDGVTFRIEENGAEVGVLHHGDPPELFQDGIPVVLEGRFRGERFDSDRIMVKHSSEYRAENPSRVKDYPPGGGRP
ncbi:MAG TPA: cytochrome c maturation protein CcmE [Acidimicrobiales bacterium]|nr:cytochrome c maturation protein CcmE [Acidimicrobiales bacterium]